MDDAANDVSPELAARVVRTAGKRVVRFTAVSGGYTNAGRRIAHFADGSSLFVKAATNDDTTVWLRVEQRIYARLTGRPFLPALAGWDENGEFPLLLLEDLSRADWPPPEAVLPHAPTAPTAAFAGFWAARAGLPPPISGRARAPRSAATTRRRPAVGGPRARLARARSVARDIIARTFPARGPFFARSC